MTARRFYIEGRVQGVFFRASTQRQAKRLGITGHAINLPDGRVEVLAAGSDQALDELQQWLGRGPAGARVDRVQAEDADPPGSDSFTTG
ncbi:MAG: acylphosphatase [Wenzhouxiangellaceae bacterium]